MVKLNRIYTKTGDDGTTGLGDGSRVSKTDPRVEAYGTVDEANAALGLCVVEAARHPSGGKGGLGGELASLLRSMQNDLFDVGADLCVPLDPGNGGGGGARAAAGSRLRITAAQTARLEAAIDLYNDRLLPLDSFVLPGGSALAAALHLGRTVVRRAERMTVLLYREHPEATNPEAVRYLNRLSDLLFVLARVANSDGAGDIKWVPGAGGGREKAGGRREGERLDP